MINDGRENEKRTSQPERVWLEVEEQQTKE